MGVNFPEMYVGNSVMIFVTSPHYPCTLRPSQLSAVALRMFLKIFETYD